MFLRYLVAAPLLLLSAVGVPSAYHVLYRYQYRNEVREEKFDVAGEFTRALTQDLVTWPAIASVVLLAVFWWMTTAWPKIVLVPAGLAAVNGLIWGLIDGWDILLGAITAPAVAWGLAWIAGRIVSWPVTADVRRGPVEVAVGLRGGGRLRVQSRRLLLDELAPPVHPLAPMGRVAIRFDRIGHVEPGVVRTPALWRLANSSELTITPGPVLRIIGAGQEWLLPVDDADALHRLITERAKVRATADPRPPLDNNDWFHAKAWWERAGEEPQRRNEQKVNHGNRWASFIIAALFTPMGLFGLVRTFTHSWSYLIAVFFFGSIGLGAIITWFNQGRVYKLNEENPVSPMAQEPDPRRIPVTGWSATPVVLGQTSDM